MYLVYIYLFMYSMSKYQIICNIYVLIFTFYSVLVKNEEKSRLEKKRKRKYAENQEVARRKRSEGLKVVSNDKPTNKSGSMAASAANGFEKKKFAPKSGCSSKA